jgi:8-oxo-dGTP pyrophosphatase MutT (NUDIX family)
MYAREDLRDRLLQVLEPEPRFDLPPDTRPGAVLLPILAGGPRPRLVFTRRTETMSRHAGEISFPGGLADPGEGLAAAALREAQEELGLTPSDVELVGALPPVHTHVSGILIAPFVGLVDANPRFTPNAAEIAAVLEFPLDELSAVGAEREFEWEGRSFQTFVYELEGHVIWGATARILWSLFELLGRTPAARSV